jgi:arylsulfatase A-like enzyme
MKYTLTFIMAICIITWAAPPKPNFIIIFTDDQGYADVGVYGSGSAPAGAPWKTWDQLVIKTPRLDQMAEEGVMFTAFYSGYPICTQSRTALMTGCYVQRTGYNKSGVLFPADNTGINPNEILLAELLKARGYATGCFGKWHLGHKLPFLPTSNGFDYYYGIPYSNDMNWDANMELADDIVWREGYDEQQFRTGNKVGHKVPLMRNEQVIEFPADQATISKRYTEDAMNFITEHQNEPFFVYLPHSMPHIPLFASEQFLGTSERGLYGDVIEEIDWNVGRLLDTVKALGLDSNTFVIYTSDNGPWLVKNENGGTAYPLRNGKGTNWEGGMRVPCIIRWPGKIPAGLVQEEYAELIDIFPTFSALSGEELPRDRIIDGKDIWPLIEGRQGAMNPHEAFYYNLNAVRAGQWKLKDGRLYDLIADIHEDTDLSAQYPDKKTELQNLLNAFKADLDANKRTMGTLQTVKLSTGCTNPEAVNYDPDAENDDGSCIAAVAGCMDTAYEEYDPDANVNDSTACVTLDVSEGNNSSMPGSEVIWNSASVIVRVPHEIQVRGLSGELLFQASETGEKIWSLSEMKIRELAIITINTKGGKYIKKWIRF